MSYMLDRMQAAVEKMNDTLKNDPCFLRKYQQFSKLLNEDRLKEAEKILLEVENEILSGQKEKK